MIMSKLFVKIFIAGIVCFSCNYSNSRVDRKATPINIIPTPTELNAAKGTFKLTPATVIVAEDSIKYIAEFLQEKLKGTGYNIRIVNENKDFKNVIYFKPKNPFDEKNGLSYQLNVSLKKIVISADEPSGYFYAVQTLLQLFPPEILSKDSHTRKEWSVPCVDIKDAAKYNWRSFMLDSGRQFQTVDFIKRYLDILAMLKINVFHWHLTEGQGWRIEIKKYPKLTEIGSKVADGEEQQGYYTYEDIREIVEYAKKRFITVVPEIDIPGHSDAALIAYPELTCQKQAPKATMGVSPVLFCAGNEKTYEFLQNVLDTVCELFPGEYIHLGGDEAPKAIWDQCPVCQNKIKQLHLKNSDDLQRYFSKRLADYLDKKGKKVIFWGDVVYDDGETLPDNVIVYWWNSRGHGDLAYKNAIKRGHPVICGTNAYCYLNYPVVPWSKYDSTRTFDFKTVYEKNPSDILVPHDLVMGMGCCLWTDWYVKMDMIDQRVFPRIYALAEQMWHVGERLTLDEFYMQVKSTYDRLKILGIDYGPAFANEVPDGYKWD